MPSTLPGWVISDADSIQLEIEPYLAISDSDRARHLRAVCRAAARMMRARPDAETLFDYRDPVPESTQEALRRLRREVIRYASIDHS